MTSLSLSSEGAPSTEEQAGIENHTEHLSASSLSSSVPDGTSVSLEDKDNDKATTTTTTTTTEEESVNDKDEESDADSEKTAGTTATTGTQSTTQTAPPDGNADYLRHELYKRLREEPDLLNWLHISVTEGIFYWDLENPENEWMSPEFKKLFGYEDWELPNSPCAWQDKIFAEDKDRALAAFYAHVGPERVPYDEILRYHHKNGSTVWVRCKGVATFDESGEKCIRFMGFHSNVTDLMQAREKFEKNEAALDLLRNNALDGYWDWNMSTGDNLLSTRWKQALGYQEEEIEDHIDAWKALLHPDDLPKALAAMDKHMGEGAAYKEVLRYRRKDGTYAHMLAQGVATKNSAGEWTRMFGTHTDVSELEEARAAARAANLAKSTFLSTMSHEIRTPLNSLLGMAQVLLTSDLTDDQRDCLVTLRNSGTHLLALLNDLLDISQIEAGRLDLINENFDIQGTARVVVDVLCKEAGDKGLLMKFESTLPPGSTFLGDSDRVRQIIFNLLGNSVKFTSSGHVAISLQREVRGSEDGVLIKVTDTGVGMTPEQQQIVFQEFTQANTQTRRKFGGTGLGLCITRKLTAKMNGTIELESEYGKGSTFRVWLPGLEVPKSDSKGTTGDSVIIYEPDGKDSLLECAKAAGLSPTRLTKKMELESVVKSGPRNLTVVLDRPYVNDAEESSYSKTLDEALKINGAKIVTIGRHHPWVKVVEKRSLRILPTFFTSDELKDAITDDPKTTEAEEPEPEETLSIDNGRNLRVLVAEDNPVNQKVILRLLRPLPCEVIIAGNGEEAVRLASEHELDLILMDCQMPIMDGTEATKIIREAGSTIPIVAVTANASTADRDECLACGMTGFLTKPIRMEQLKKVVHDCRNSLFS